MFSLCFCFQIILEITKSKDELKQSRSLCPTWPTIQQLPKQKACIHSTHDPILRSEIKIHFIQESVRRQMWGHWGRPGGPHLELHRSGFTRWLRTSSCGLTRWGPWSGPRSLGTLTPSGLGWSRPSRQSSKSQRIRSSLETFTGKWRYQTIPDSKCWNVLRIGLVNLSNSKLNIILGSSFSVRKIGPG